MRPIHHLCKISDQPHHVVTEYASTQEPLGCRIAPVLLPRTGERLLPPTAENTAYRTLVNRGKEVVQFS
jgi:hypothetical protein